VELICEPPTSVNFPLISTTPAVTVGKFIDGVIDTGGKYAIGAVETSGKFSILVIDTGGVPPLANISANFCKISK
jgi:hypothetical protein